MRSRRLLREVLLPVALGLLGITVLLPAAAPAQEEVASASRRYKEREARSGYQEAYEVKPWRQTPWCGAEMLRRPAPSGIYKRKPVSSANRAPPWKTYTRVWGLRPAALPGLPRGAGRPQSYRAANLNCRQCHGGEPIAGINYYFSPLNPIRRHAYVCTKCHEGATASFATFMVHEPSPGALSTKKPFLPSITLTGSCLSLIVGTLGFFGAHPDMVVKEIFIGLNQKSNLNRKPTENLKIRPRKA